MAIALAAAARLCRFIAYGFTAALAIRAAVVLFALRHGSLGVLASATRLPIFHFTLLAAAGRHIFGIGIAVGSSMMAATFRVLRSHIMMATALSFRRRSRVRRRLPSRRLLCPSHQ
jgi:hypothetical protein